MNNIQYKEIIKEILEELRVTEDSLMINADGYSSNSPGFLEVNCLNESPYKYPVVQISQRLSKKILGVNLF